MDKRMTFHVLRNSALTYALMGLASGATKDTQIFTSVDMHDLIAAKKRIKITFEIEDEEKQNVSLTEFLERLAVPA